MLTGIIGSILVSTQVETFYSGVAMGLCIVKKAKEIRDYSQIVY